MAVSAILNERCWGVPSPAPRRSLVRKRASSARPRLGMGAALLLLPVAVLAAVTTAAAAVMVPVALLMGWL